MKFFLLILLLLPLGVRAEILSTERLATNEKIVVEFTSAGDHDFFGRFYVIRGPAPATFFAIDSGLALNNGHVERRSTEEIGNKTLTSEEATGIDCLLVYLRRNLPGNPTFNDRFKVEYFRGEQKIGEESFVDRTGIERGFYLEEGKLKPKKEAPADFPPNVYRAIVPFSILEERVKYASRR